MIVVLSYTLSFIRWATPARAQLLLRLAGLSPADVEAIIRENDDRTVGSAFPVVFTGKPSTGQEVPEKPKGVDGP